MVQWLRLHTFTTRGTGSIPGWGPKTLLHDTAQKTKKRQKLEFDPHTTRKLTAQRGNRVSCLGSLSNHCCDQEIKSDPKPTLLAP